ncbi:hypothetical protein MLD38_016658 [Melastoma candidum]|uniref:Uncharacterized protein n=1 Tax=Melastoma candidum TaxID=119954 RepID=A0ACB9QN69_9MYRT|nr:hypothetical protein MLD38_016658 [Melastoma candidum]
MADIARPEISPNPSPSKIGNVLSFLGNFVVESTLADFLYGISGRKKVHEFVQQKVKGTPQQKKKVLSSYYYKRHGDATVIVHDVQGVVKRGQEEAIKLHQRCAKSLGGTEPFWKNMPGELPEGSNGPGTDANKVFLRSRL